MKKNYWPLAIGLLLLTIVIDQASKGVLLYLLTGGVPLAGDAWALVPNPVLFAKVTSFFNLVFTWNPGTSFSLFRALGESAPLVIIILTGIIIGFLGYQLFARKNTKLETTALALIVGGAMGNLLDRIRFGAVIDFLDFHWSALHWPAFNLADTAICIGVALYLFYFVKQKLRTES